MERASEGGRDGGTERGTMVRTPPLVCDQTLPVLACTSSGSLTIRRSRARARDAKITRSGGVRTSEGGEQAHDIHAERAPATPKGHVPSTPKGHVPSTPKGHVPATPKGHVPSTPKGHVPSTPKGHNTSTPDDCSDSHWTCANRLQFFVAQRRATNRRCDSAAIPTADQTNNACAQCAASRQVLHSPHFRVRICALYPITRTP
jgi:hypothetical protein